MRLEHHIEYSSLYALAILSAYMNGLYHIFECARRDLVGWSGNYAAAYASLEDAVKLNDSLVYDAPWGWMQPPRHALGALLLEQVIT
jgi:hypothetical protein